MRYEFTPEQLAWRDEVRAFIAEHLDPRLIEELREIGNEGTGPHARQFVLKLRERGWWGLAWPKEYGGLQRSAIEQWIFVDELEVVAREVSGGGVADRGSPDRSAHMNPHHR